MVNAKEYLAVSMEKNNDMEYHADWMKKNNDMEYHTAKHIERLCEKAYLDRIGPNKANELIVGVMSGDYGMIPNQELYVDSNNKLGVYMDGKLQEVDTSSEYDPSMSALVTHDVKSGLTKEQPIESTWEFKLHCNEKLRSIYAKRAMFDYAAHVDEKKVQVVAPVKKMKWRHIRHGLMEEKEFPLLAPYASIVEAMKWDDIDDMVWFFHPKLKSEQQWNRDQGYTSEDEEIWAHYQFTDE